MTTIALAWMGLAAGCGPSLDAPGTRILYVSLSLRRDSLERDTRNVEALRFAPRRGITHVMLKVPSWQEVPDAPDHPLIERALRICRDAGMEVIWARNLWVAYPKLVRGPPVPEDCHLDASFYAAALRRVKTEAKRLGVSASALDAEPYAYSPQKAIKGVDVPTSVLRAMRSAIADAVAKEGQVDFVTPTASGSSARYPWAVRGLGRRWIDQKTYRVRKRGKLRRLRPPVGFEPHRIDVWAIWIGRHALDWDDLVRLDWKGPVFIYIDSREFATLLEP